MDRKVMWDIKGQHLWGVIGSVGQHLLDHGEEEGREEEGEGGEEGRRNRLSSVPSCPAPSCVFCITSVSFSPYMGTFRQNVLRQWHFIWVCLVQDIGKIRGARNPRKERPSWRLLQESGWEARRPGQKGFQRKMLGSE